METEEKDLPLQEEVKTEETVEETKAEESMEETQAEEAVEEAKAEETEAGPEATSEPEATEETEAGPEPVIPEADELPELPPEQVLPEMTVGNTEIPAKKKMSKTGKTLLIIGIVSVSLILALFLAGWLYFNRLYKLSNYQKETSYVETTLDEEEEDDGESETIVTLAEEEKESLAAAMKEAQRKAQEAWKKNNTDDASEDGSEEEFVLREEGISNILLIGMDEAGGNSDAIIICSIDYGRKRITLTSIMRDTAAYIPGYGARKINSAAAISGPPLTVETVEQNFMIDIDNYAMVNFQAMKAVIDALGGVDMFITVKEAEFMKIEIPEDRVIHMTGKMAVRHSRDRTSGGYDYGRTQRQKNVLLAIIDKARSGGLGDVTKAAETVLPYITHDFSRSDLLSIMMNLPSLINFEFEQARIPFDGLYHNEGEFLVVDTAATVQKLKEIIYGD